MLVFLLLSCRPDQPPPEEASAGLHPEQGLTFGYRPGEVEVTGADWSVTLRPLDWGREDRRPFAAVDGVQDGALVRYVEPAAEAWYMVEPRGLEQGFELLERPEGEGPMGVRIALDTELSVLWRADGVDLSDASGWRVARYQDLVVVDAAGQVLPSTLTLSCDPGCVVNLAFDDTHARYPITVDPLLFGTLTTLPVAFAGTGIGGDLDGDVAVLSGVSTSTVIHRFGSGTWSWEATVVGTPPSGLPVVSGDLLAVPRFQGVDVFVHSSGTWTALSPQPVTGGGFLGSRVAIDGTRLVHSVPGGVDVFNWNGSTFVAGPTYSGGFQFSPRPVALSGTWFVTHEANSLLFFDISTGLVGPITLTGVGTFTGGELQMHGDRAVLGTQSFAFDGTTWAAEGVIPYTGVISSVTVRGDRVIYSDEAAGQLTVFQHDGSAWILTDTFSHGTTQFGRSVALGDDRVLVSDNAGGGHVVAVSCQTEIEDNGIDEDCDGYDALCHTGSCGTDIVVTEFLTSPVNGSPADGVWVEVANLGSAAVDLKNMEIVTTNGTWAISGHLVASPGEHVLVAASAVMATNGGVVPDQVLAGLDLPPNAGFVQLNASGGGVLDLVPYVPAFSTGVSWPEGASVSLDPSQSSASANDQPFSWCDGRSFFGAGDFGTPGMPNQSCTYDLVFDLTYQMVAPPNVELFGLVTTFAGRTFSTSNSGDGTFTRTTTPLGGTVLNWTYNTTGVVYTGTQTFGENCIPDGAMSNLPASASSGAWNDLSCP